MAANPSFCQRIVRLVVILLSSSRLILTQHQISSHPHHSATPSPSQPELSLPALLPRGGARQLSRTAAFTKSPSTPTASKATTASSSKSLSPSERFLSGGVSRALAQAVLYPIDALRTLAQTRDHRTLADVGTSALVRGCVTTSSFALFIGAIQFSIYGMARDRVGPMVASALGAAGSCLISVPQEVIKQRLVTGVYDNFRGAVTQIWKKEGIRGFYSAWRPTVGRNVPFVVTTFVTMDWLKSRRLLAHKDQEDGRELSAFENFAIGISSAFIAGALTNPVDVVKTRMMTQQASTAVPYTSAIDCVRTIWNREGWKTFYAGFGRRSLYMGPLWALQFTLNGYFTEKLLSRKTSKDTGS